MGIADRLMNYSLGNADFLKIGNCYLIFLKKWRLMVRSMTPEYSWNFLSSRPTTSTKKSKISNLVNFLKVALTVLDNVYLLFSCVAASLGAVSE